jgi:hypothetical protein
MPYREIVFVTDEVLLFYQKQQPKIQIAENIKKEYENK